MTQVDWTAGVPALFAAIDADPDDVSIATRLATFLPSLAASTVTEQRLSRLRHRPVPRRDLMTFACDGLGLVWHNRALFAIRSPVHAPKLSVDGTRTQRMRRAAGSDTWYVVVDLLPGATHSYEFQVDGVPLGVGDIAAYGELSHPQAGVTRGEFFGPFSISSDVYPGTTTDYWIYLNAGVAESGPAPSMIWLDGQQCLNPFDGLEWRMQVVSDNLVATGRLPPMVHVLVASGSGGDELPPQFAGQSRFEALRSLQYDTASPRYGHHLLTEVLPHVATMMPLHVDGRWRGVAGQSSGGACAFGLAWFHPAHFGRVLSVNGSFTKLRSHDPATSPGAAAFAPLVTASGRCPARVWIATGEFDLDVGDSGRPDLRAAGSWLAGNRSLADALFHVGSRVRFTVGRAGHNSAQAGLDVPEALAWLWSDDDAPISATQ